MKERNVTVTLDKAREWFNSGNTTLREVALQAFSKDELVCSFKDITTFKEACEVLGLDYITIVTAVGNIAYYSKSSAAAFKLNIIRKALNLHQNLSLTKSPERSHIYYPLNPLVFTSSACYESDLHSGRIEIIGKIKSGGKEYNVLGGGVGFTGSAGLGSFTPGDGVCSANASFGFLGCANAKIAEHFGKYFGMLITEAKYADMIKNFEIVESKYAI